MKIDKCTAVGLAIAASVFAVVYLAVYSIFPERPEGLAFLRNGLAAIPAVFCGSLVLIVTREVRNTLTAKDS